MLKQSGVVRDKFGKILCKHGRYRRKCKSCGGAGICHHGRLRNRCRDCHGAGICPHNRRIDQCLDCRPYLKCEHGTLKYRCYVCHPKRKPGRCIHGKSTAPGCCMDCDPRYIFRLKIKKRAKIAGRAPDFTDFENRFQRWYAGVLEEKKLVVEWHTRLAELNTLRIVCSTAVMCEHGKRKCKCGKCRPKKQCVHGRRACRCRECGTGYCEHGKRRERCGVCDPSKSLKTARLRKEENHG